MAKQKAATQNLDGVEKGEEIQPEQPSGEVSETPTHDEFGFRILSQEEIQENRNNVWKSQMEAITETQLKTAARLYPEVQVVLDENAKLRLEIESLKGSKKS